MRVSAFGVTNEAEARKDVQELAANKADMVKIWVDDRGGTVEKMPPNLYRAIIDEAHKHNLRVLAHTTELADAKALLRAGLDGFAHMVRDKDVDDEFMAMVKARPNVFFLETLWGERRALYDGKPAWLDDPALRGAFSADDLQPTRRTALARPKGRPQGGAARPHHGADQSAQHREALRGRRARISLGTDTGGVIGRPVLRPRLPCGAGTSGDAGRPYADAGDWCIGTRTSAENLGLADLGTIGCRQERRFHRARRQSARQHRQYAADQSGLSARPGNSACCPLGQVERPGLSGAKSGNRSKGLDAAGARASRPLFDRLNPIGKKPIDRRGPADETSALHPSKQRQPRQK